MNLEGSDLSVGEAIAKTTNPDTVDLTTLTEGKQTTSHAGDMSDDENQAAPTELISLADKVMKIDELLLHLGEKSNKTNLTQ